MTYTLLYQIEDYLGEVIVQAYDFKASSKKDAVSLAKKILNKISDKNHWSIDVKDAVLLTPKGKELNIPDFSQQKSI
ncbi:MAG: hypothetical protein Q8Q35_04355 [Nanoarchaeota archaeon]|nr:hypothetical protein [Nanoarchaeota archaeon]